MGRHDQELAALGLDFESDGDAWQPTPHGRFMAAVLAEHPELARDLDVLELGAGVAIHTVVLHRMGARSITATEHERDLLDVARANFERHFPGAGNVR